MTIQEISEHVKKKFNEEINEERITQAKGAWRSLRGFLENVFSLLGKTLQIFFHFLRFIFGFVIIIASAFSVAGLVSILSILWVGENAWLPLEFQKIVNVLLSDTSGYILFGALFVTLFIPLLIVLLIGSSLLAGKNLFTFAKTFLLFIFWIIALTLTVSFTLILKPRIESTGVSFESIGYKIQNL